MSAGLPASAADPASPAPDRRLKELENALQKGQAEQQQINQRADQLAKEMDDLRNSMVNAARAVQEHEETLSELELQLTDLTALEKDKAGTLELRRQQMNGVLTALERLAFRPSEALIAQPTSPADTVRSAILLRNVLPQIQDSAKVLRAELDSLASVRADVARQKKKISATAAKLDDEHRRLSTLYGRKKQLQQETEEQRQETAKRLQAMAAEAEDLRDLLARLEQEKKRREQEAAERVQAERAAREAEKIAAKAAREAEIAAAKAAREAAAATLKAEKEKHEAEIIAARQAKQAEEQAARTAKEAQAKADKATREADAAAAKMGPASRQGPAPWSRPFSQAEGEMPFPARGRVVARFGQNNESGSPSRGITIAPRPGAQVVSPYDGQVVFAGPFRGYGLLLIIEHGEGYHTLLAGMARIDGNVGQHLLPGEPVGVMGQSESKPLLYVELRRNGQPVNPLPWFTAHKTKVSG
ncbi:peptidoglycan DD-metalloendopeptidase family protein [Telmatospirillum sp.]|uniref:murein hydrolase activator EnvC family protein n=1 Tax=Telmatospirillum sp. TaxID=2079197 RepID=UPI002845CAC0|nr:peptidoglycan DD-metalloendopeptidase family protein [Telmatospirillum sp.]MDR3441105.1 peptidoglycan DD-metalloendopeptidase family protein [Telmatospirillum sp.]